MVLLNGCELPYGSRWSVALIRLLSEGNASALTLVHSYQTQPAAGSYLASIEVRKT
jgi:hypothetical protein